jgi:hypothetical protein
MDDANVTNAFATTPVNITFKDLEFEKPVLIDLMTGKVYEISKNMFLQNGGGSTFENLPLYDSPMLIAEMEGVKFNPASP